jgi:hypothetical protein
MIENTLKTHCSPTHLHNCTLHFPARSFFFLLDICVAIAKLPLDAQWGPWAVNEAHYGPIVGRVKGFQDWALQWGPKSAHKVAKVSGHDQGPKATVMCSSLYDLPSSSHDAKIVAY